MVATSLVGLALYFFASLAVLVAAEHPADDSTFVGWRGASFDKQAVFGADGSSDGERWIETISWTPRAFIYHNFLSHEEANDLIVQAAPYLQRSTVVGSSDSGVVDSIRTSYGTFLGRLSSPAVERLEKRLANWTQLPIVHQEDIQILRYDHGQKYGAHYDALGRLCTVLVYLADIEEGGETAFPRTTEDDWADPEQKKYSETFSDCAKGHVAFKPKKGDALLFYSLRPDGKTTDDKAMHTGCPLIKGVKWTATIWIHPTPFRATSFHDAFQELKKTGKYAYMLDAEDSEDPGRCQDSVDRCADWAKAGECERNAAYMKGSPNSIGKCRKSCKACKVCERGDHACYQENRVASGLLDLADEVKRFTGRTLPVAY